MTADAMCSPSHCIAGGRGLGFPVCSRHVSRGVTQAQLRAARPSAADPPAIPVVAKAGPGAALGSWAEGTGRKAVEQVFARSASLNGDAVVIFVRALCAVSQEELVPVRPGEAPRWGCRTT